MIKSYLFRQHICFRMSKNLDHKQPKKWWGILSHKPNTFTQFLYSLLNPLSITFPIRLLKNNPPQFHHLPLLNLRHQPWIIILHILNFLLIKIFGNQLNPSLRVIHLIKILIKVIINLSKSLLPSLRFRLERLYHFI